MWLTRSLCEKICVCLATNLEKTIITKQRITNAPDKREELLFLEHQTALSKLSSTPNRPVDDQPIIRSNTPMRLCNSVNINVGKTWKLQFYSAEKKNSFEIKTDRKNIHQILSALISKCTQANWNIKGLPVWGR